MSYLNFQITLSFHPNGAFAQVVRWFRSKPVRQVRESVIQAVTAYYYPEAVQTRAAIAESRRALEQRLMDLVELERSLDEKAQETFPEDFGVDENLLVAMGNDYEDNF